MGWVPIHSGQPMWTGWIAIPRPTVVPLPLLPIRSAWQVKDLDISSELMRKGESLLQQFQRSSSGAKLKEEVPRG